MYMFHDALVSFAERRVIYMKIVILQGSPNKNGSTSILVEEFSRGAKASGHMVQKDDNQKIKKVVLEADMIVFATPLYYYGMSAQLKTVIDRFCSFNSSITRKHMKSALLSVAWNSDIWTFDVLESHYRTLVRYLDFQDQGAIFGKGCGSPSMTKNSYFPKMAYEMGKRLV